MQVQPNASRLELTQERHEVLQTPAEAIHAPRSNHVELAPRGSLAHPVERWTPCAALGAAHAMVDELLNHPPAGPSSDLVERLKLLPDRLMVGRYPRVERYLLLCHAGLPY
jgi:hypothetical protein